MGVKVSNVAQLQFRVLQRRPHYPERTVAIFRRLGDVIRVARHPIPNDFRQNRRISLLGVLERFQRQYSRAFTNHKPITVGIERPTGMLRILVAR